MEHPAAYHVLNFLATSRLKRRWNVLAQLGYTLGSVTNDEFVKMLHDAEVKMARVKALYEQYFQGMERMEPAVPKKDLERTLELLRKHQPRNTALRFRTQQILARYTTYLAYWQRITRGIEEGRIRRDPRRPGQVVQRRSAPPAELDLDDAVELGSEGFSFDEADIDAAFAAAGVETSRSIAPAPKPPPPPRVSSPELFKLPVPNADSSWSVPPPTVPSMHLSNIPQIAVPKPASLVPRPVLGSPPLTSVQDPTKALPYTPRKEPLSPARAEMATVPEARIPASVLAARQQAQLKTSAPTAQAKPAPTQPTPQATPIRSPATALPAEAKLDALYKKYIEARKKNNEPVDKIKPETLVRTIEKLMPKLQEKHGKRDFDFEVVVSGGRVGIRPKVG